MRTYIFYPVFTILIFITGCSFSFGQNLLRSRQTGYYNYIFRISNNEAKNIYTNNLSVTDNSFFHTLVDSFPQDKEYTGVLPPGHYLQVSLEGNQQNIAITTVRNFDVFVMNNTSDLCVQVTDLNGKPISDAVVKAGHKKLKYDAQKQLYTDLKSNRKGLLEVSVGDNTQYLDLDRNYNNSAARRAYVAVCYRTPLRYVWIPVRYFVFLPIDGVRSLVQGYALGSIRQTRNILYFISEKARLLYLSIQNPDEEHEKRNIAGYMVFDKPQYRPGDTVHLKSYLTKKNGHPVRKDLTIVLYEQGKEHVQQTIHPEHRGVFSGSFVLHDSLQLTLDEMCYVDLRDSKNRVYKNGVFQYSDYELKRNRLQVDCKEKDQYRGNPLSLKIKATDDNGLTLQDARVEILVTPSLIHEYFSSSVFIPDTLIYLQQALNPQGETEILLNDSSFPAASFAYDIAVHMRTTDNELNQEKIDIEYHNSPGQASITRQNDSLVIRYTENGLSVTHQGTVMATDAFGVKSKVYEGEIPCTLPLNPRIVMYSVVAGNSIDILNMSKEDAGLICYGTRQKDSVHLNVYNPSGIEFTYDLYRRNKCIRSGRGKQLGVSLKDASKKTYSIHLNYLWAGEVIDESRQLMLNERNLRIDMQQPDVVFPGQKTTISVQVTDYKGKPVKDVDLTAWAVTKKFSYTPPEPPYRGKFHMPKRYINSFELSSPGATTKSHDTLDYAYWRKRASLDTLMYYQFVFPGDSIFRYSYPVKDSITQFAPFVFSGGQNDPVHIIYVDNSPVFFSWASKQQPYSFRIDSGFHQITLRTETRLITIDSLYFNNGEKTIFSINNNHVSKHVQNVATSIKLTPAEKTVLYPYIMPYKNNFPLNFALLKANNRIFQLGYAYNKTDILLAGPISGNVELIVPDQYEHTFTHEANYEYEFARNLIKMRSANHINYPEQLWRYEYNYSLRDTVLSEQEWMQIWKQKEERNRMETIRFQRWSAEKKPAGKLHISYDFCPFFVKSPLCILLLNAADTSVTGIFPGDAKMFNNLIPGWYQLITVYPGKQFSINDSILIKADGINHYDISPCKLSSDTVTYAYIIGLIERNTGVKKNMGEQSSMSFSTNKYCYDPEGNCGGITGVVMDGETGERIPFCNVFIQLPDNTLIGTTTDFDGLYSIPNVPSGNHDVTFAMIGYEKMIIHDVTVFTNNTRTVGARLNPSACLLSTFEVVDYNMISSEQVMCCASSIVSYSPLMIDYAPNISEYIVQVGGVISMDGSNRGIRADNTPVYVDGKQVNEEQPFPSGALIIIDGYAFTGDIAALNQMQILRVDILSTEKAAAKYGAEGKNGVVEIMTRQINAGDMERNTWSDVEYLAGTNKAGSLRSRFSDVGYWQPELITDKNGHAEFEVVFPDDVTCWKTFCIAMNSKRQSGSTADSIKSYKPLMAQLFVPLFLTQGDSSAVIGKILNYTPDSISLFRFFETGTAKTDIGRAVCANVITDTLTVVATDSLKIKYQLIRDDGYFDGEVREIPVFSQGLERASGSFYVLRNDTTIPFSTDTMLTETTLYASADELDVLKMEISNIIYYRYDCNEQMASKLKAMLAEKTMAEFSGNKGSHDREIRKLIDRLSRNRNNSGLWGWWNDNESSIWMSLHVVEALVQAHRQGYDIPDLSVPVGNLIRQAESTNNIGARIRILNLLALMKTPYNYVRLLPSENELQVLSLTDRLELASLKQKLGIKFDMDSLFAFQQTTLSGNVFFSDSTPETVDNSDIQNTLRMYRILKTDSSDHMQLLQQMRNYFFEKRVAGAWQNTYESVQIISTLLPDLLDSNRRATKPVLKLSGDTNITVTQFPFSMSLKPGMQLSVTKTGSFPVYLTTYSMVHDENPQKKENDFAITTYFKDQPDGNLAAGSEATLCAHVIVKKDAEYVMINVPVPGGCSYASKKMNVRYESHREYFRNETTLFCEQLPAGTYTFEIGILPRFSGTYTLNPASISLMYFPVFNANNETKTVRVK